MNRKIIITGATGLVGTRLCARLAENNDIPIIFTRAPQSAAQKLGNKFQYVKWDYNQKSDWNDYLNNADAVIHLAGENLMSGRWTAEHKERVYNSRVESTRKLVEAIKLADTPPQMFIGASASGYYPDEINSEFDETSEPGNGFLPQLVSDWEKASLELEELKINRSIIRIGVVLSEKGGALPRMITPFKLFVGGPLGTGKQWFPWIHIDDLAGIIIHCLDNNSNGIFNAVSPESTTMEGFTKTLGKVMNRPSIFTVPGFILKIILGEAANTVIKGSKIIPANTKKSGYNFNFPKLETALKNLLN